ncbi:hypothetical protein ACH5RR_038346 [Cinchona calisaya]|uniref:Crooked neck protein n=1 Tax=Cinchona calisaya TaxID=153742 RepID=A0ABD2XWD1_9GENT
MKNGEIGRAWNCYERAVEKLGDDEEEAEELFFAFVEAEDLYKKFLAFEQQYGDRQGIEDAIVGKRRFQYEDEIWKNPLNYDAWFDYIRLEESVGIKERVREVYKRAIANLPPAQEKRYWQRYIYSWLCLKNIPHEKFSFSKIWLLAAQFEIRQLNLQGARLTLGAAIGRAPKDKIFKKYIEIELQLVSLAIGWSMRNKALDEEAYIDFEISEHEFEKTRCLYERLLNRTKHIKVWLSYAKFEASAMEEPQEDIQQKEKCIQRARGKELSTFAPELKEERAMLLEEWLNLESSYGELGNVDLVRVKLKKRRHIETEDHPAGYEEEYIDYHFPEEPQVTNLKILEAAYKWKKKQKVSHEQD